MSIQTCVCVKHEKLWVHFNISLRETFLFVINDKHKLLQDQSVQWKLITFPDFLIQSYHATFVYHSSIAGCRYHEQFLPISFHVDRPACFLQSCKLYKTSEYWEIQIFKTRKNKQIEKCFCDGNTYSKIPFYFSTTGLGTIPGK